MRTIFRRGLYLDIHRRFIHSLGHDTDDGPRGLYGICKSAPALESATWAGEPLERSLDRHIHEFEVDSDRPYPDPDVMRAKGTSDLEALVALEEQRRELVRVLESDGEP